MDPRTLYRFLTESSLLIRLSSLLTMSGPLCTLLTGDDENVTLSHFGLGDIITNIFGSVDFMC